MPIKLPWTAAMDTQLRRLRGDGATWDAIAAALGLNRHAVIERGRRIGARLPPRSQVAAARAAWLQDRTREPLPAGHPVSWDALTAGSVLAGQSYCHPGNPAAALTAASDPSPDASPQPEESDQ
jgi:hypothetical protein